MSEWKLTNGCCSCCGDSFQRCARGEDMRVLKSVYGEKEDLCSYCHNKEERYRDYQSSCPPAGNAPVEVDRSTGTRKVLNSCPNCYYHYYPCGQCKGNEEVMTYAEFRSRSVKRLELPENYEDFLSDKENAQPDRCV